MPVTVERAAISFTLPRPWRFHHRIWQETVMHGQCAQPSTEWQHQNHLCHVQGATHRRVEYLDGNGFIVTIYQRRKRHVRQVDKQWWNLQLCHDTILPGVNCSPIICRLIPLILSWLALFAQPMMRNLSYLVEIYTWFGTNDTKRSTGMGYLHNMWEAYQDNWWWSGYMNVCQIYFYMCR